MPSDPTEPRISLVIPAWNEAACLPRLLDTVEATRFTPRRLGLAPALVLNSARKWDKHGDWHMIPDVFRAPFYILFARKKVTEYARRYWYEDR